MKEPTGPRPEPLKDPDLISAYLLWVTTPHTHPHRIKRWDEYVKIRRLYGDRPVHLETAHEKKKIFH